MAGEIRVAVCGAGVRSRQAILPALHGLENVKIVGLCDIAKDIASDAAARYGIPRLYTEGVNDYQRMARELAPDAVFSIGNPHQLYDSWMWLLENGIPLAIEKPLGLSAHQSSSLAYMARRHNVPTQVLFQRRYTPVAQKALAMCRARGDIVHAVCRFYKCEPGPFIGARDHLLDDTVHSIDTLRWICGGEIEKIESHTRRVGTPDINFISATLHFDNGSSGYLINSWSSGKRVFSVEMHAPGIFAEVEHEIGGTVYQDGNLDGLPLSAAECAGSDRFEVFTGVTAAISDFTQSLGGGRPAACRFGDAVKSMHAAHTILAQSLPDLAV